MDEGQTEPTTLCICRSENDDIMGYAIHIMRVRTDNGVAYHLVAPTYDDGDPSVVHAAHFVNLVDDHIYGRYLSSEILYPTLLDATKQAYRWFANYEHQQKMACYDDLIASIKAEVNA